MRECFKCGSPYDLSPIGSSVDAEGQPTDFVCKGCVEEINKRIDLSGDLKGREADLLSEDPRLAYTVKNEPGGFFDPPQEVTRYMHPKWQTKPGQRSNRSRSEQEADLKRGTEMSDQLTSFYEKFAEDQRKV